MIGLWLIIIVLVTLLGLAINACGRGDRISGTSWFDMPMIPLNRRGRRQKR